MNAFPVITQAGTVTHIAFALGDDTTTTTRCEFVLDFNSMGKVIGIEIISLKFNAGQQALDAIARAIKSNTTEIKYNYDAECDCFALQLDNGNSIDQKAVDGIMFLNRQGEIIALSADAAI
jgi:uncharacterized protein YuzE